MTGQPPASGSSSAAGARPRGRPARERTTPLHRAEILEAAHRIVHDEGLQALSMRRLATDLGVTPMAIYHYLPDKRALVNGLIEDVWAEVGARLQELADAGVGDLVELLIQGNLATRRIWLDHLELANLAMAVAPADDDLISTMGLAAAMVEAAGFPDVSLAFGALQTYTMGSIATTANRRVSSAYFGRDPEAVLADARRLLEERGAPSNHRGVVEARFDEGDDRNFEPGLRRLVDGLLQGPATTAPRREPSHPEP